uniref:POTRA domain-containing protein n=1 Tax=Dasya naccarioides TaxID=2007180 RepID=A0A1Z1MH25_9FLOR|nr:hypothetical protein [Dasya naccarioides]ARW65162.1 hypothetical protein [Dasya naccarioides]
MLLFYSLYNNYFNKIIVLLKNSSFNINLIYNVKNNSINETSKKIHNLKFHSKINKNLRPEVSKTVLTLFKIKVFNKTFMNKLMCKVKESGYFNKIEYNYLYINKSKYIIFRIRTNAILKKIKIYRYKKLNIPKNFLIKLFKSQVGLPINYKLINFSISQINRWYKVKGFEWNKVNYTYFQETNEVKINIFEGEILNSYCIYDEIVTNLEDKIKINQLNYIIKKELDILSGKTLNIHDLESKIINLKQKYFINYIKYKVEYNLNNINITVKYNLSNFNKLSIFNKNVLVQNYFRIVLHSIKNDNIKKIRKLIFNIYKNFIYQYNIAHRNIKYKSTILNIFINIQFNNKFIWRYYHLIYNKLNINNSTRINQKLKIIIQNIYVLKYYSKNIIHNYSYDYLRKILIIKIKLSTKYLNKIQIIQTLNNNHFKNSIKYSIFYHYNNFHNFINIYKLKFFNKIKKNTLFIYKIKIKYSYIYLLTRNDLMIYYKIYINFHSEMIRYIQSYKFYLHHIKLNYDRLHSMPKFIKYENVLSIIINLNIFIGHLYQYQNILQHFSKYIIIKVEYQLYINKKFFIYLYYEYKSNQKKRYSIINKNFDNSPLYLGIGTQIYIPIEYISSLRLEIAISSYKEQLFYFYIKPLLII